MAANRMLSYSRAVLRKKQQIWYETRMWNSTFSNQKEETIHRQQNMTAEASGWMKICAALLFASEFVSCGSRHRDGATVGLKWKKGAPNKCVRTKFRTISEFPNFTKFFKLQPPRLEYIFPRICGYRNTQRLESKFVWIFFFTPQTSSWLHHFK